MSASAGQVSAVVSGPQAREVSKLVTSAHAHAREARILAVDIGAHGAAALMAVAEMAREGLGR